MTFVVSVHLRHPDLSPHCFSRCSFVEPVQRSVLNFNVIRLSITALGWLPPSRLHTIHAAQPLRSGSLTQVQPIDGTGSLATGSWVRVGGSNDIADFLAQERARVTEAEGRHAGVVEEMHAQDVEDDVEDDLEEFDDRVGVGEVEEPGRHGVEDDRFGVRIEEWVGQQWRQVDQIRLGSDGDRDRSWRAGWFAGVVLGAAAESDCLESAIG